MPDAFSEAESNYRIGLIEKQVLTLTEDERMVLLSHFCRGCGTYNKPGDRPCQCWNDD